MNNMQQSVPSRKRPAPGTSPLVQQTMAPQPQYQYQQMPDNPDFSNFDFSSAFPNDQAFADPSLADANNNFAAAFNTSQPQTYGSNIAPAPSTDLVRRARNQQLAPQPGYQEQWNGGMGNMTGSDDDDLEELKRRAEMAKNDARGKRKQIPPFVQKLSSFLDHANTDLIRWSDDGKSFIVLDEDEFARKLIPELFKHNNYASFVRQLNMYGFHKTVNITDGSLRQSEKARKGVKPPSMYSHPYFRRGQPELLWLIQKPSSKSTAKRKRDGKDGFDSDDERQYSPGPDGRPHELGMPGGQSGDVTQMPRGELAAVRQELKKLQQQQNIISRMIGQLKEQNDQFYRQATAFQALHDRHENSINAILTFLATFYNRSLDGHSGQNLVNMFNNQGGQNNQQTGVVEEYNDNGTENNQQVQKYVKRPQLLLTDSAPHNAPSGIAVTQPNSARASASPPQGRSPSAAKRDSSASVPPQRPASASVGRNTASPVVKTDAQTPDVLHQVPENDEMLNLINNVNASTTPGDSTSTPAYDFSAALNHYQNANGNAPLTANQRDDMLQMIANQQGGDASDNNALTIPNMPAPNFNLDEFERRNKEIENLQDYQKRHDEAIKGVEKRLGQFSPSGSISGSSGMYNGGGFDGNFTIPDDLNFQDYLNDDSDLRYADNNPDMFAYNLDGTGTGDTGDDMFNTGDMNNTNDYLAPDTGAGKVESVSSEATSPATGQVEGDVDGADQEPGTPNKRQRRS